MIVLLDTGSAHTWVLTEEANRELGFQNYYDSRKSSTFYDPEYGVKVGIQFGIGALGGIFVQDRLVIGDVNDSSN